MSTYNRTLMIAILAAMSFGVVVPAYAAYQEQACPDCSDEQLSRMEYYKNILPLIVSTDKSSYDHQSIILVNGHVKNPNPDQQVTLVVSDPTGNVVQVDQVSVESNGDFETKLSTASSLWKKNGVYTMKAQYGTDGRSNIAKFELMGEPMPAIPEFGAIAALVLAIAIISIIAVSAKTRLRLMPKY